MHQAVNDGAYFWEHTTFRHSLRIDPKSPINIQFLPTPMQVAMYSNMVLASTPISVDHLSWIEHNCNAPYVLGNDYILFSDETDRTLFLSAH